MSAYRNLQIVEVSPGVFDLGEPTFDTDKVVAARFLTQLLSFTADGRGNSFQTALSQENIRTSSSIRNVFGVGVLDIIEVFRTYEPAEIVREATLTNWSFSDDTTLRVAVTITLDEATVDITAGI